MDSISPASLYNMVTEENEFALVDLREDGSFGARHLLFAVNIPFSHLEFLLGDLIPNRHVPIILCGTCNDGSLINKGASKLSYFGYKNISMLEGGIDAWEREGFELFSGVNVPSKAFGEFVEKKCGTPHVSAEKLEKMIKSGEKLVILDSRPMSEYEVMNIPGGINVPGAELSYRIADLSVGSDTTIVVNCAGRTRSIIGAQTLINAGIPNKVVALENGTMGWHLAGKKLEYGSSFRFPGISKNGHKIAKLRAKNLFEKFDIKFVDFTALSAMLGDLNRTTYLLDVRDPSEYDLGHIPGSVSAPGGQLVQATDQYVGIRNSRLILIDDDDIRAVMTASWLKQMGWPEVFVFQGGVSCAGELQLGPYERKIFGDNNGKVDFVNLMEFDRLNKDNKYKIIDLASSTIYRDDGHIPGAYFAIRANLSESLNKIGGANSIILTSPDGKLAEIAASDEVFLDRDVKVLKGGTDSWVASGLPLEKGFTRMADDANDVWYRPYDFKDGVEGAMKQYLSWEIDLLNQIKRDGTANFQII